MFKDKPHRLRSFDYLGPYRYFLTFCTFERQRVFTAPSTVSLVLDEILLCCGRRRFALLAYCFMPDHVHLLVEGLAQESDGRQFIRVLKLCTGHQWAAMHGAPLWQRYGYERVLRAEEDTLAVVRYILENPLRAGLVKNPEEFPYSGSGSYSMEELVDAATWVPPRSG